jgi:hypothetical protein
MDATTRWETEAMRSGGKKRQSRPKPSRQSAEPSLTDTRHWVTLKDAEQATGIPTNTLRKWVRKAAIPSYLEADGELALRMVDLDAVIARAEELGRDIVPQEPESTAEPLPETTAAEPLPAETMIVPIDAWNKMLNQLGNLHEAGQQLAEARERAAKAETESKFLRAQLAEGRVQNQESGLQNQESRVQNQEPESEPEPTTTYWRYLTSGWRDRKKRQATND